MRRRHCPPAPSPHALVARARRAHSRGERRRALVALREAALLSEHDPRLWALYGAALVRSGQLEEARYAFGQAVHFRERRGERARAQVLRGIVERLAA